MQFTKYYQIIFKRYVQKIKRMSIVEQFTFSYHLNLVKFSFLLWNILEMKNLGW